MDNLHGYIMHPKNPASLAQLMEISGLWPPQVPDNGKQLRINRAVRIAVAQIESRAS